MKSLPMVFALVVVAACGGKGKGGASASPGGEGDDSATPFHDGSVKAALGNTPGVAACGVAASTTMGAHVEAQRAMMKSGGNPVDESFTCRAQPNGTWECEWAVFTRVEAPEAEAPEAAAPEAAASTAPLSASTARKRS